MTTRSAVFVMVACTIFAAGCGADPESAGVGSAELGELFDATDEDAEPRGLLLVIDAVGPLVVIDRDPELAWGTGAVTFEEPSYPTPFIVTRRSVDPLRIPATLGTLPGRHVVLHGERAELCTAELGDLELVRRTDPEELYGDGSEPPTSDQAWQAGSSRVVLGSRPRAQGGDCSGAAYATFADAPVPVVFANSPEADIDPSLAQQALDAFRELDSWHEIQSGYASDLPVLYPHETPKAVWEQHDGAEPSVSILSGSDRTLVGVHAEIGSGCGDFGAGLWALFELGDGSLELAANSQIEPFPTLVFDAERDGRLEMIFGQRLLFPSADGVKSFDVEVPSYGCSC